MSLKNGFEHEECKGDVLEGPRVKYDNVCLHPACSAPSVKWLRMDNLKKYSIEGFTALHHRCLYILRPVQHMSQNMLY